MTKGSNADMNTCKFTKWLSPSTGWTLDEILNIVSGVKEYAGKNGLHEVELMDVEDQREGGIGRIRIVIRYTAAAGSIGNNQYERFLYMLDDEEKVIDAQELQRRKARQLL